MIGPISVCSMDSILVILAWTVSTNEHIFMMIFLYVYAYLFQSVFAPLLLLRLSNRLFSEQQLVVLPRRDQSHYHFRCRIFDATIFSGKNGKKVGRFVCGEKINECIINYLRIDSWSSLVANLGF